MFKILNSILLLLILLSSTSSYAADDGDWWLQRQIQLQQNREDYARRVYGSARHTYDTVDPITSKTKTITKTVIVEDVPSKAKLGKGLLERAKAFKGGAAGVLGGAAVSALIEAIGWLMEDGTYVKYKPVDPNDPTLSQYCWTTVGTCSAAAISAGTVALTVQGSCTIMENTLKKNYGGYYKRIGCYEDAANKAVLEWQYGTNTPSKQTANRVLNPLYDPNKPNQPTKITITDSDVGGIASGDYQDPVNPIHNITDKQYRPVVAEAYKHDPSGIGNDLANEMDDRLKNAPPTSDGKPAPIGDTRFSTPPQDDQITNDRSWNDDGSTATGDTTPTTDPTTGEPTGGQSISLQFPIFCEWAHTMCKWYDDWKASDKVYKDHMTKTEEHQTEEKGFWQSVNDWFDWTKDDSELPERDDSDLNTTVDFEEKNISLNVSPLCPAPTFETITLHGVTSQVKTSDYTYICQLDWLIKPFTIGFATIMACFILFGFNRGSEE